MQHQRSKHIELHMPFIRKLVNDHVLEVLYCSIEDQVANIFTKTLTKVKFTKVKFTKVKFTKLQLMVGVQEVVIKGE